MAIGRKDKEAPEAPSSIDDEIRADTSAPDSEREPEGGEAASESEEESEVLAAAAGDEPVEGEGEGDEDIVAAQLGTDRYVLAGVFASGMLLAFVLGRFVHGVWLTLSNKDWFSRTLPALAGVGDDDKSTWATVIGAIAALVIVVRTYRRPEIRSWSHDVANELAKVKWPTKKEVSNSTVVVIAATAVATIYLMLLDRLWAFVTNLVYSDGS